MKAFRYLRFGHKSIASQVSPQLEENEQAALSLKEALERLDRALERLDRDVERVACSVSKGEGETESDEQ